MIGRLKLVKNIINDGEGDKFLSDNGKYFYGDSSYIYHQDDKINVTAPFNFTINIPQTTEFNFPEINVLKIEEHTEGNWIRAEHNVDYDYTYSSNETIDISILSNGTYKINY